MALKNGKKCLKYFSMMSKLLLNYILIKEDQDELKPNFIIKEMKLFISFILELIHLIMTELELSCFMNKNIYNAIESLTFNSTPRKINISWTKSTSIAYFMHIQYVSFKKINHDLQSTEIFSSTFFSLLILLSASLFFMISTENRLICMQEFTIQDQKKFKIKTIFEKNHQQRILKEKKLIFSKILHLKAIYLLSNYLDDSPLLDHFRQSFSKNYETKEPLKDITEESIDISQKDN